MKIFSGEDSRDMWARINSAKTVEDLQNVLYKICCKLQELEALLPEQPPNQEVGVLEKRINKVIATDICNDPAGCKFMKCTSLFNGVCHYDGECKYR